MIFVWETQETLCNTKYQWCDSFGEAYSAKGYMRTNNIKVAHGWCFFVNDSCFNVEGKYYPIDTQTRLNLTRDVQMSIKVTYEVLFLR